MTSSFNMVHKYIYKNAQDASKISEAKLPLENVFYLSKISLNIRIELKLSVDTIWRSDH